MFPKSFLKVGDYIALGLKGKGKALAVPKFVSTRIKFEAGWLKVYKKRRCGISGPRVKNFHRICFFLLSFFLWIGWWLNSELLHAVLRGVARYMHLSFFPPLIGKIKRFIDSFSSLLWWTDFPRCRGPERVNRYCCQRSFPRTLIPWTHRIWLQCPYSNHLKWRWTSNEARQSLDRRKLPSSGAGRLELCVGF